MEAYERMASLGGMSSLRTWVFAIALNTFWDHAGKNGREIVDSELAGPHELTYYRP